MIKNVLTHIGGIEVYGIISVLLFFAFFTAILLWAFTLKRSHLDSMGQLPLDDGTPNPIPVPVPVPVPSTPSQPNSRHE